MIINLTIPMAPKAQKRDRITARGGFARSYKDKGQRLEEDKLLTMIMALAPPKPLDGPISLEIKAYLPIPKSKPRIWQAKAASGELRPTTKPDCDNLAKQICDVMQKVFFQDDKQVVSLSVSKHYTVEGPARWVIRMEGDY